MDLEVGSEPAGRPRRDPFPTARVIISSPCKQFVVIIGEEKLVAAGLDVFCRTLVQGCGHKSRCPYRIAALQEGTRCRLETCTRS